MTTRALEDTEIKAIFDHISGWNARRNETLFITGIGMALRASELVGLQVGDVYDKKHALSAAEGKVKAYVEIRGETAKFKKSRTIRIGDDIQGAIADFLDWKGERQESVAKEAPLFFSQLLRRGSSRIHSFCVPKHPSSL